jgi:arginyl-tRNA synthetase
MIAIGYAKYGSEIELEKDPIGHLRQVYIAMSKEAENDPKVKANAADWFNQLEVDRDTGIESKRLKDWEDWRARSIKKYEQSYHTLNVKFDIYTGESVVGKESMDQALVQLEAIPDLVLDVDGAKILDLEKYKLGKTVLRKKGMWYPILFELAISELYRRFVDLSHTRHRWWDRAIRQVQI